MINDFLYIAIILIFSVLYHELGHYIVHSFYDRNPELHLTYVSFDRFENYPNEKKELDRALVSGIYICAIPIDISAYFQAVSIHLIIFMLAVYLYS